MPSCGIRPNPRAGSPRSRRRSTPSAAGIALFLTTASLQLPYYPDAFVAPNGKVFVAGSQVTSYYLDPTGTGAWSKVADRNVADRYTGSAAQFAPGKILYAGGGEIATPSAEVID